MAVHWSPRGEEKNQLIQELIRQGTESYAGQPLAELTLGELQGLAQDGARIQAEKLACQQSAEEKKMKAKEATLPGFAKAQTLSGTMADGIKRES